MGNIVTTVAALSGGVSGVAGVAKRWRVEYGGTFATDDQLQLLLTDTLTAQADFAGFGTVTGLEPSFVFTFNDKVNILAGSAWYFSAVQGPTDFNNPNSLGNGFIELSNISGTAEDLVSIASYQGGVAIISRRNTQIWNVDPDAGNYSKRQVLENIGTVAKNSVKPVGDMDIYMLADNGVRSVRVRDASNNAIIADIGTPVDEIIQTVLKGLTDEQRAQACAVVEPSSNRYWLYLPTNYIYVFNYFPSSQIAAWSRYRAVWSKTPNAANYTYLFGTAYYVTFSGLVVGRTYTFQRGTKELATSICTFVHNAVEYPDQDYTFVAAATTATVNISSTTAPGAVTCALLEHFAPEKFVVQNGRVYARSGDNVFLYGGLDNQTYDRCFPQWDIPFLNAKSPATRKVYHGLDAICEGTWLVKLGTNVADANDVTAIYNNTGPSLMRGKSLAAKQGTHFKLRGQELSDGYARFSSAILHYEGGDNK